MLKGTRQYKRAREMQHTYFYRHMEIIGIANMSLYCGIIKKCPKCHRKGYLHMRQHGQFQIAHYKGRMINEEGKNITKYHYCPQPNLKNIINRYLTFLNKDHKYTHRK